MLPMSQFNDGKRLIHGMRNLSVRRALDLMLLIPVTLSEEPQCPKSPQQQSTSQCCFLLSARLLRRTVAVMRMVFQMRNQAMLAGVGMASVRACMPMLTWEYG